MVSTFQEKLDGDFLLQAQAEAGVVHVFPELLTKFSLLSSRRNGGFTLLELLVVVALIAMVAGAAVMSLENTSNDAAIPVAQSEMVEIAKAIRQFKRDTGVYPTPVHPADFSDLLSGSLPTGLVDWNVDAGRGWRGPYLTRQGTGWVTVCDDLLSTGVGDPAKVSCGSVSEPQGLADPFELPPSNGLLEWSDCPTCAARPKWGRPYLLFDLNNGQARIVSMGPDGIYNGNNASNICAPNNDDLVLCLK